MTGPDTHRRDLDGGPPIRTTDGRVIYAIADIHGRYDLFARLLDAIVADIGTLRGDATPLLILCGGHIDCGPASDAVMAALVWLRRHAPMDVRFLRGGHEAALFDFVDRPDTLPAWRAIGGDATLRAYGVDPGDDDAVSPVAVRDALLDRMPASHLTLLREMPASTTCGGYLFVHDRAGAVARGPKGIVVHGRGDGSDRLDATRDRIGIDTGAWRTGVLTAVRLDGATAAIVRTETAAHTPDPADDPASDDIGGAASLRDALTRLRPGY